MMEINSPRSYQAGFNQAEQLRDKGLVPEAAALYHALLAYWLQQEEREPGLPFTINEFLIIDRLADLSLLLGNKEAAGFLLSAVALQAKTSSNTGICIQAVAKLNFVNLDGGLIADAKKNLGMLSYLIGDADNIAVTPDGLQVWEQSIKFDGANRQDQADQLVCLYDVLGAIKVAEGKFADGCLLYSRGVQIAELCPSPVTASRLLPLKVLLAGAYFGKGELQLAKKQLAATEKEAGEASIATGLPLQLLELRSRIALAEGEMGQAYELAAKTGDLCRKYHLPLAEIHADFNLAQAMIILNQTSEASDILKDCRTKAQNLGEAALADRIDRFLQVAENSVNITLPAANYGARVTQQTPTAMAETAPDTVGRPANMVDHFAEVALQFQVYLAKNEPDKAGEALAGLRHLFKGCDSALLYFRLQVIEFTCLYYTNQTIPVDWPFQRVLDYLTGNHLLPELWQFRRMLGHSGLIPESDNAAWLAENQAILDRITASLPVEMQTLYLLNKWSPNEEYLAAYSDSLLGLKDKTENTKLPIISWFARRKFAKALLAFKDETGRYKDYLSRNMAAGNKPGAFAFLKDQVAAISTLSRQPKNVLTIFFLVLPDRVVIISSTLKKISLHLTLINRTALRQLVFALRDQLYPEGRSRSIGSARPAASAALITLPQILPHLDNVLQLSAVLKEHDDAITDIKFLADDILHGLPFTLLHIAGQPLPEKYRISVATDEKDVERQSPSGNKNVLIAGVADYRGIYNNLPGVTREVGQVKAALEGPGVDISVLLNEETSVSAVKSRLAGARIAHFSCHGTFNFQQPEQSGLLLSGGELFSLKDISSVPSLQNVDLIVLSSCRGAEHYILPGRWIIGLPETFCRAGVRAVLAFLWPVHDDFATAFSTCFYGHLKQNTPAEAFRQTVLDAKNRKFNLDTIPYWEPQYWAGAIFYQG